MATTQEVITSLVVVDFTHINVSLYSPYNGSIQFWKESKYMYTRDL